VGSDVGDIGNSNVGSTTGQKTLEIGFSRKSRQDKTRVKAISTSYLALLYKRMSKERRKGNPPMPTTLSLYTIHLPPSNHSPCSNVPSESHPMILHTTNTTPDQYNHAISSDIAIPHTTSLSYSIIPPPSRGFLRVSQRLRLSVTPFLPHPYPPISRYITSAVTVSPP